VRDASSLVQQEDWVPAEADRIDRPGAWLSLFNTSEGFRHTYFITESPGEVPLWIFANAAMLRGGGERARRSRHGW
jgi:hypothetical protein